MNLERLEYRVGVVAIRFPAATRSVSDRLLITAVAAQVPGTLTRPMSLVAGAAAEPFGTGAS
jgi:hypothetical protein